MSIQQFSKCIKHSWSSETDFEKLYKLLYSVDLVEYGKLCNRTKYNPLINLVKYHKYDENIEIYFDILLEKFTILNQDHEGNTVLHYVQFKRDCLIKLMFHKDYKKCAFIKNNKGNLPIHTMAYEKDLVNLYLMITKISDDTQCDNILSDNILSDNILSDNILYTKNNNGYTTYDIIKELPYFNLKDNYLMLTNTDIKNIKMLKMNDDLFNIIIKYI